MNKKPNVFFSHEVFSVSRLQVKKIIIKERKENRRKGMKAQVE